jgi:hypothetical protein
MLGAFVLKLERDHQRDSDDAKYKSANDANEYSAHVCSSLCITG